MLFLPLLERPCVLLLLDGEKGVAPDVVEPALPVLVGDFRPSGAGALANPDTRFEFEKREKPEK